MTEDNTVSPVVGVIILVAITVILAAVIGASDVYKKREKKGLAIWSW